MDHLLIPLAAYPQVTVGLRLDDNLSSGAPACAAELARLCSAKSKWIRRLKLYAGAFLQLTDDFEDVKELDLFLIQHPSGQFWHRFDKLSHSLEALHIREMRLDAPPTSNDLCKRLILPCLTTLFSSGSGVWTAFRIAATSHLPALDKVELQLDFMYDPQGPIELGDGDIALASLQSLVLLDKALPSRLKAKDRRYDLAFNGDLQEWREYLEIVVPLSARSDLTLDVDCTLFDPETTWYHSPGSGLPGDVESLAAVFAPEIQACISSLAIRVDRDTRARPVAEWKMYLPRVTKFVLHAPDDDPKWPMHIMHQLFSN